MKKMKLDKRSVRNIGFIVLLSALVALTPKAVKKIKEEKRAHEFYEYLMDEVDKYVEENITEEKINIIMNQYKENSWLIEEYVTILSKDSVAYVKDIARSAHLINNFDKKTSFKQAEENLKEEGYNIIPNVIQFADIKKELSSIRTAKRRLKQKEQ